MRDNASDAAPAVGSGRYLAYIEQFLHLGSQPRLVMFFARPPFKDRRDAGRQLAAALLYLEESAPVVCALPRGGVPVSFEVAQALKAPLDVMLVRKIGAPYFPELGIGAVAEGGYRVLDRAAMERVCASDDYVEAETQRQMDEIKRRRQHYCGGRAALDVRGRTVIVVDDGIATGGTMRVALEALAAAGPERLLFAVPVAPRESLAAMCDAADDGICLLVPDEFRAVGQYYANFEQTTDEEVIRLLNTSVPDRGLPSKHKEKSMQTISDIMTHDVTVVSPQDNIQRAAQMMSEWNVGALPVCDGQKLQGMITDRDITIRATAGGRPPEEVRVAEVMTDDVMWCYEDETIGEVLQQMGDSQIRRIPVVDRDKNLVGMVSLGDIATRHDADTDETLEDISSPSEPNRQGTDEMRLRRPPSDQADGRF